MADLAAGKCIRHTSAGKCVARITHTPHKQFKGAHIKGHAPTHSQRDLRAARAKTYSSLNIELEFMTNWNRTEIQTQNCNLNFVLSPRGTSEKSSHFCSLLLPNLNISGMHKKSSSREPVGVGLLIKYICPGCFTPNHPSANSEKAPNSISGK